MEGGREGGRETERERVEETETERGREQKAERGREGGSGARMRTNESVTLNIYIYILRASADANCKLGGWVVGLQEANYNSSRSK